MQTHGRLNRLDCDQLERRMLKFPKHCIQSDM